AFACEHPAETLQDRHVLAGFAECRGGFQADVAAADDHDALGGRQLLTQVIDVAARAQGEYALQARARTGEVSRPSARGPYQRTVVNDVAVLQDDAAGGGVDRHHRASQQQRDVALAPEGLGPQYDAVEVRLSAQVVFAELGSLVRHVALGAHDRDRSGKPSPAQSDRELRAAVTRSHDEHVEVLHQAHTHSQSTTANQPGHIDNGQVTTADRRRQGRAPDSRRCGSRGTGTNQTAAGTFAGCPGSTPPSSSSMCVRMISSKECSPRKPSAAARRASKLRGQPSMIAATAGSGSRLMSATARSPATRRRASICSPTVAERPGMLSVRTEPRRELSMCAACSMNCMAARGLANQWRTDSLTGNTACCPLSGSRRMLEKKPDAALLGLPGRIDTVGSLRPTPSRKPRRV